MGLFEEFQGFSVLPCIDQGNISLDADMGGTGRLAGGSPPLFNGVCTGHGLGIEFIGRLAVPQVLIKGIGNIDGACLGTFVTCRAFGWIDKSGLLQELDLEVSGFTIDLQDLGHGQKVDIEMAARFNKFGRNDAHGAVIGGEGLVKLGHDTADSGVFLDQMDQIA